MLLKAAEAYRQQIKRGLDKKSPSGRQSTRDIDGLVGTDSAVSRTGRKPYRNAKGLSGWTGLFNLVAGARYTNYMQIAIEPFPLVA